MHPFSFSNTEIISESKKVYNNIESTEGQILHYIIWENFEKNKNLVIQCSKSLVYIYDIFAPIFNLIKLKTTNLKDIIIVVRFFIIKIIQIYYAY